MNCTCEKITLFVSNNPIGDMGSSQMNSHSISYMKSEVICTVPAPFLARRTSFVLCRIYRCHADFSECLFYNVYKIFLQVHHNGAHY